MKKAQKAQISFEFMTMVIMAVMLVVILAWSAYYFLTDYSEQRNIQRIQDLGYSLQNEVVLAYNVEPGYSRTVYVPERLGDYDVEISMSENGNDIIITYKGNEVAFRIPTVSGSFATGYNTIQKLPDGSVVIS